jgi:hypothetical protein
MGNAHFFIFKSKFKWVVPALLGILLLLPLRFMIAAHPNEYIYFNELSGALKKPMENTKQIIG